MDKLRSVSTVFLKAANGWFRSCFSYWLRVILQLKDDLMKKFSFEPPKDEDAMKRNWLQLINNTHTQEYDPFDGQTPAAKGFTNVTSGWGTYSVMGPIVYFSINMYSSGAAMTWTAASELHLPIEAAIRDVTLNLPQQEGLVFPVMTYGGIPLTTASRLAVFSMNAFGRLLNGNGDTTGSTNFNVSGWYFR